MTFFNAAPASANNSNSFHTENRAESTCFSAFGTDIGFAHRSASSQDDTGDAPTPSEQVPARQRTVSGLVCYRKPFDELAAELDRHLSQPSPQVTLFYVMDKLARATSGDGASSTEEMLQAQRDQTRIVAKGVESALVRGWNAGLLEVYPDGAIRITPAGDWYVKEGRARRLALWKTNPRLAVGEICAIVQIEDGDGPVYEVPLELVAPPARERQAPERQGFGVEPAPARRGRPARKIAPVWAGLLAAPRRPAEVAEVAA
jgi:hypothetical protein